MSVPRAGRARAREQARDIGVDGLVCSAEEAANLRGIVGPGMVLVTPGIRPAGSAARRPEAHHDAGARDRGRRRLSRGRPADRRGGRSEGGGRGDRRRDRTQATRNREDDDGEGLLDRARRCEERGGLQALRRRQRRRSSRNSAARFVVRGGKFESVGRQRALAQRGDRISRLCRPRSPATARRNIRRTSSVRQPHSTADIVIIEGYDGPQP